MLDVIEYGIFAAYSCDIRTACGPCVRRGNIQKYSQIFDDIRFNIHDGRRHNRIPARTRIQSNMYRILLEYGSNIDLRENDPTFERKRLPTPPSRPLDRGTPLLMSEQLRVFCLERDSVQSIWALWVLRQGHRQNCSRLRPLSTPVWTSSTPVFGLI